MAGSTAARRPSERAPGQVVGVGPRASLPAGAGSVAGDRGAQRVGALADRVEQGERPPGPVPLGPAGPVEQAADRPALAG